MEDFFQIILFALFALFSLVSNLLNKRKKQQAETRKSREEVEAESRRPEPRRPDSRRPDIQKPRQRPEVSSPDEPETRRKREEQPSTFEEILRELTGESPLERRAQEVEEEDDYEHPFNQRKAREAAEDAKEKIKENADSFGESVQQAKGARRISDKIDIEESIGSKRLEVKTAKSGKKKKNTAASIARSLKNPESARKAIILSEIIRPKYF